jgi:hypothetical protein
MTDLNSGPVPLAVRVSNARFDGLVTGYVRALRFNKADPGGHIAASFIVDQRLGFRRDMIQPYSRIYIFNKRNGDTVFEGDVSHPGRDASDDGELLQVQVDGGVARLSDWSGARIWVDRDMQAWLKTGTASIPSTVDTGDDRGGTGADALTLAFPEGTHVDLNYRAEVGYWRIREAGQELGRLNYSWDGGLISGSPGWQVRTIVTPPSTVTRTQSLTTAGSGGSGAVVGGSIPVGANVAFLQLIWTGASSSTGSTGEVVWVSFLDPVVVARLRLKDGSFRTTGYTDGVTAVHVWEDLLGDMLATSFDGVNAQIDTGTGYVIQQLAFPDGVTPLQVADALMTFETGCTYLVGASLPGTELYSLRWLARSDVPRYEFVTWVDDYEAGSQSVDQFDVAVTRWKSPTGVARSTVSTQSIPEMTAVGRSRRYFQDLTDAASNISQATQANSTVLNDHRFPQNGGKITVSRPVVDLFTGRRVQPYEIEPGYMARIVGVNPSRDAVNNSPRNGSSLCRVITTDYDSESNSVSIDLDSEPWSMYRAIARAKPTKHTPQRQAI